MGHIDGCLYGGSGFDHGPCTCQPPTVWGPVFLYSCDCCEEPRTETPFTLCETCEAHQDEPAMVARVDHEHLISAGW